MPSWCISSGTLSKGLFLIILILIVLEYLFGSFMDTKKFFLLNTTTTTTINNKFVNEERNSVNSLHSPLALRNNNNKILITQNNNLTINELITNSTNQNATAITNFGKLFDVNMTSLPSSILSSSSSSIDSVNGTISNSLIINTTTILTTLTTNLPLCEDMQQNFQGRIEVKKSPIPTVIELEKRFNWLKKGGHWSPKNCKILKSVAIIIPFRCRGEHLLLFLQHMHPFLKRQQLDYTIFIIEQDGNDNVPFNRAMLMNIGFKESLKLRKFDCFIFHDIDLLPEDDRNLYNCPIDQPRHMSVAVDILKYKLPYSSIFGGVSAINRKHFQLLNGFSNSFWGWGGEDDDMSNRIRYHNLFISRYPITIARYTMLTHKKGKPSPNRYDVLKRGQSRYDTDGLNNLNYKLVESKQNLLYTWLLVRIKMPR